MNNQVNEIAENLEPKPANQRAFSILIPSWNNLPFLKCCIESIRKNSAFTHQIIVHVNEGADGTLEWLQNQHITYTHTAENVGVCKALNMAFTQAQHDLILYLNDDMYVAPQWDERLLLFIHGLNTLDFYISATMVEPIKTANVCAVAPFAWGTHPDHFQESEFCNQVSALVRPHWNGSTWPPSVVHRTWWLRVGGYSEEFSPGMYSDPDFSMKLWQAGIRYFAGVGDSLVYHFMSKSVGRVVKNDGRKQFLQKWGISARFFRTYYLQEGTPFRGALSNPNPIQVFFARLLGWVKSQK